MLEKFKQLFLVESIAVDITSGNIIIYQQGNEKGKEIKINEPAVVISEEDGNKCIAKGEKAETIKGISPEGIQFTNLVKTGIVAHSEYFEQLMSSYISELYKNKRFLSFSPDVLAVVPEKTTMTNQKILIESIDAAGAKNIDLVTSLIAAANGLREHNDITKASIIMHIGRDYSEVGIISLNKVHFSTSLNIGYVDFIRGICEYIRNETDFVVGESNAEKALLEIGTAFYIEAQDENQAIEVSGMLKRTSVPHKVTITKLETFNAIRPTVERLVSALLEVLEHTKEDMAEDIHRHGIHIVGIGAKISRIDIAIESLGIKARVAPNYLTAIAEGAGKIQKNRS
ncbi:rod shape-determining protein [Photobacterium kishitanii]|uniref:Rod shape-determining protein n=1 Tax=Photobacterium kishitanii TaxID=318456 RepID=A0A2T3KMP2_9GAMM|nr:rod shape-determining protein [Photobacterium kishitanii]PSV01066.1 hypothetical protein C9J27_03345 [Photobacterium kishitanii]